MGPRAASGPSPARPHTAVLTKRGAGRWRSGHPWIFRDDVGGGPFDNGDVVDVVSPGGDRLGSAFYGSVSKIALRRLAAGSAAIDDRFFRERIAEALAYRGRIASGAEALRLVSSDADGLPGLVVDRYRGHLVVQSLTAGIERRLDLVVDALRSLLSPESILLRGDAAVRALEGLPLSVRDLHGTTPASVVYEEEGLQFEVDLKGGQKTGAFLDQRENRVAAARYLEGRVLDAFCYDGGFGLHAARRAESVEGVDASESAVARASANARRNGIAHARFLRANVFDYLHEAAAGGGPLYDGVVLDPPAFAKSRKDVPAAARAYKEINLRAMKLLKPGGTLVTCSCSYNLGEADFVEIVASAAADARRRALIVEKRSQSRDHPVLLGLQESHYLKCLILTVV